MRGHRRPRVRGVGNHARGDIELEIEHAGEVVGGIGSERFGGRAGNGNGNALWRLNLQGRNARRGVAGPGE
jgi:hypothetical protein